MELANYKKRALLTLVVIVVALATTIVLKRTEAEDINKTMARHCATINKDPTRPDLRRCVRPISLVNNVFTFQIQNSDLEVYRIVKAAKDDSIEYYYIFETSKKTR